MREGEGGAGGAEYRATAQAPAQPLGELHIPGGEHCHTAALCEVSEMM